MTYEVLGGLAALGSACAWAFGSILFRKMGDKVSPFGMNLGKGLIGLIYLGVLILLFGIQPMSHKVFFFLAGSGLLGIAVGDTFFFKALMNLGPRLTMLLEGLGPIFTVLLAVIFLGERPSVISWFGMTLVIGGIVWVLSEQSRGEQTHDSKTTRKILIGIQYMVLAALSMSIAIIFAKVVLVNTSTLQATWVRILWGVLGLAAYGSVTRSLGSWLSPFKDLKLVRFSLFAVFIIIFGGFWLSLVALKLIDASTATVLNFTTPLFILPMVRFYSKEKITFQAVLGTIVTVGGIALIFVG